MSKRGQAHCGVCRDRGEQFCPAKNPSSTDSLREAAKLILDDLGVPYGLPALLRTEARIEQYGLTQRIDELTLNLRYVGHTECSEYGKGIVYSTKERLAELERKKEEL